MIYEFVKVTQVTPVYEFKELSFFFFNWTWLFCSLFLSYVVKKIVLEKNHVIELYKIIKIKGCKETTVHTHSLHHEWQ